MPSGGGTVKDRGGIIMASDSNSTARGRAGEFFVAHLFEMRGIECYHAASEFDLIANVGGSLVRIEVKSASKPSKGSTYQYLVRNRNADVYAFVALDVCLVRLLNADELTTTQTISLNKSKFTYDNQEADIARLIAQYRPA
jgi:hypothetical protein